MDRVEELEREIVRLKGEIAALRQDNSKSMRFMSLTLLLGDSIECGGFRADLIERRSKGARFLIQCPTNQFVKLIKGASSSEVERPAKRD